MSVLHVLKTLSFIVVGECLKQTQHNKMTQIGALLQAKKKNERSRI